MKKIIILVTSLLLVFTLTGCEDFGSYIEEVDLESLGTVVEDEIENEEVIIVDLYEYATNWGSVIQLTLNMNIS